MENSELKKVFAQKKEKLDKRTGKVKQGFKDTTSHQFAEWYDKDVFEKGCYYCGLTNSESKIIFQLQRNGLRNDATRGGKRGSRLEIDRVDPSLCYDRLNNLVWCCYWCNNAKSNFFSLEEFRKIGKEIGKSLRKIIREAKKNNVVL
jgi:hypothetical protein